MKTLLLAVALLSLHTTFAQTVVAPTAYVGMISRMTLSGKAGLELQAGAFNAEAFSQLSLDNPHPVYGVMAGITTQNVWEHVNIRLVAGPVFHSGMLPVDSDKRIQTVRPGCSIRLEFMHVLFDLGYNGETFAYHMGYIFKKRRY